MFIDNTAPLGVTWAYGNAGSVTTVFTAASNTNGIIIRTLVLAPGALAVSDTSAPSGYNDSSKRPIFYTDENISAVVIFPYPLLIASGNGLWVCAQSGASPGYIATWDAVST